MSAHLERNQRLDSQDLVITKEDSTKPLLLILRQIFEQYESRFCVDPVESW